MKKKLLILTTLLSITPLMAKEVVCDDVKENYIKVNSKISVRVTKIGDTCSFAVETSRDKRKYSFSNRTFEAFREWSFGSDGKVLIYNSYGSGPTDSSSTAYKGYQTFPTEGKLKLITNSDGTFSMSLPNGAEIHFLENGGINQNKTKDMKLKDVPIKVPNVSRNMSAVRYDEIDHLSYNDSRKREIRLYHRKINLAATSSSVGLETNVGMYIPLGATMGEIPGNKTGSTFTLYGKNDKKLCSQKMRGHHFFDFLVRCSSKKPNKLCACKYSEREAIAIFNKQREYRTEIMSINSQLRRATPTRKSELHQRLRSLEALYNPDIHKEVYHYCTLDKARADAFVAERRISGDSREIDDTVPKSTSSIIESLRRSNKCRGIENVPQDCVHCTNKEVINVENIEKQEEEIRRVIETQSGIRSGPSLRDADENTNQEEVIEAQPSTRHAPNLLDADMSVKQEEAIEEVIEQEEVIEEAVNQREIIDEVVEKPEGAIEVIKQQEDILEMNEQQDTDDEYNQYF